MIEPGDRLKTARTNSGFSTAKAAADYFGWNENTYRSHENSNRGFPVGAAKKYAKAFKVPIEWLLTGENQDNFTLNVSPPVRLDKIAPVKGEVAAGVWLEHEFMDDDKYPPVAANINPKYSDIEQYALRVKGDSMDKYVKDGEHVICIDFAATGEAIPEDNKVVVVRRERAGTTEYSLKRVRRLGNGDYELWPESNNPLFQKPIGMGHKDEGTTVTITGLVIGRNLND